VPEEQPVLLSTLPPSRGQERLALIVAALLLVAYIAAAPFMHIHLASVDAFIPVVDTTLFLTDTITAALLFAQFSVLRSRALLALASGYLFTGLLIVPHGLTFPGAFTPTGLLGAGLQTTVYLYIFWHFGLPCAAIAYTLLKRTHHETPQAHGSARGPVLASISIVVLTVTMLTWLVTAGVEWLPDIMVDAMHSNSTWHYTAPFIIALSLAAIGLLWARRRSVLDMWLLVVLWAWLLETLLLSTTTYRFSLVWYAGRIYGLLSASFVLLALLSESTMMYARLALSVMAQRRDREGRLMTMDTVAASIAHEINQPLGAIVINSSASLRWLEREPPDLDEARAALKQITSDGHRASKAMESIRAIFKQDVQEKTPLIINEIIRETITLLHGELHARGILLQIELAAWLPMVLGHRGQLQQVVLNIVMNAAEAMSAVTERGRVLRVCSATDDSTGVLISIEDSGIGIDSKDSSRIFDAFYTTKSDGMGLGLAICRSIVESHGGRLWVSPRTPHGAVFHILLSAGEPGGEP
jgi:signal transduction histidine kinase